MVLYSLENSIFNFSLLTTTIAFIIYNASTGRIFLGDFGSYMLSSFVAFKSIEIYVLYDIPVFLLASILIYPCFELSRSLLVRFMNKTSLMSPDNYHLHNYVYEYLLTFGFTRHLANSITGIGIAVSSSTPSLLLYFNNTSISWFYLFMLELIFFSSIYFLFYKKIIKIT